MPADLVEEPKAPVAETAKPARRTEAEVTGKVVQSIRGLWAAKPPEKKPDAPKAEEKPKEGEPSSEKPPEKPKETVPKAETAKPAEGKAPEEPKFLKRKSNKEKATEVGDAVGEAVARAVKPLQDEIQKSTKAAAAPKPEPTVELDEDAQDHLGVLQKLESSNPTYKGVAQKFREFKSKEREYEEKWLAANPDGEFDPDAEEHEAFYKRNEPTVKPSDFKKAERELLKEEVRKELKPEFEREIEPIRQKAKLEEVTAKKMPVIRQSMLETAKAAASAINEDWGKMDDLTKVAEADPLGAEVLNHVSGRWLPMLEVAGLLYAGAPIDNDDPAAKAFGNLVGHIEKEVLALPEESRIAEDGRRFTTISQWHEMSQKEKARHWFVGEAEVNDYVRHQMSTEAKKIYDSESKRLEGFVAKKGYVPKSGHQPPKNGAEKQQEEAENTDESERAPAVNGSSAPAPAPASGGGGRGRASSKFLGGLWR